jgi:act minimal PKS acyl carrier protein
MDSFTAENLRAILLDCAGAAEHIDLDNDFVDTTFSDLGYDSLALLEVQSRIERNLTISLPDNTIRVAGTPGDAVAAINEQLATEA